MPTSSLLVATWGNGLFSISGQAVQHAFADQVVRGLAPDGRGGVLGIVGGHLLCRRSPDGAWTTIATSDRDLACCEAIGDAIFVGTEDAQILRVESDGVPRRLTGFDAVEGRDRWYAGAALVDGKLMGPPLGIRSMAATCDGAVLLANVHVGGIPRSTDGGLTWQPTIDIDTDVHQVCAHPTRPNIVIAAAAAGFCMSRDGGATWSIVQQGLHAHYCSAVAFAGPDIFVAASTDHFAPEGAVYRRPIDGIGSFQPVGGLPRWMGGIVDSDCIAVRDAIVAVIDQSGCLYVSHDNGATWSRPCEPLPNPGGLHIC